MKYVRDGDGPTIQFRKLQEKVFLHYKGTNTWPDEVFVDGKVRFTGTKPQWNFIQGRVVFFSNAVGKPYSITVDESLGLDFIAIKGATGEKH